MAVLNFHEIYTSFLVALLLGAVLFGLTIGQTMWYFTVYPKDLKWHLGLVGSLFILDFVHMIVLCIACYFSVLGWMNPAEALRVMNCQSYRSLPASIAITYILTFLVQSFFLVRIWILSRRNKLLTFFIAIFTTIQLASGLVAVAEAINLAHLDIPRSTRRSATVELVSSFIADLTITLSLVYYLNRGRSAMDYATATNSVLNRLILFAISTGLLTSLATLANLALFVQNPDSFVWVVPHVITSKLYVNSILVTLNSRRSVRDIINHRNSCLAQFSPRPPSKSLTHLSLPLKWDADESFAAVNSFDHHHDGNKAREYDPNVDYARDLLPASPQLDASAHQAVETQRDILAGLDKDNEIRQSPGRERTSVPAIDICIPSGSLSPSFETSRKTSSQPPPGIVTITDSPESDSPVASPRSEKTQSMIWSPITPTQSLMRRVSSLSALSRVAPSLHSSRLTARTYNTNTQTQASGSRRGSTSTSVTNFPFNYPFPSQTRSSSMRHTSIPASVHYSDNFISFSSIASATHRNSAWASGGSGPNLFVDVNAPPVPEVPDLPILPKLIPSLGRDKDRTRGRQRTFSGSSAPGSDETHTSGTVSVNYTGASGAGAAILVSSPKVTGVRNSSSSYVYRLPIGPSSSTTPKRSSLLSVKSRASGLSRSRERKSSSSLKSRANSPNRDIPPPPPLLGTPLQPWYSPSLAQVRPKPVVNPRGPSHPAPLIPSGHMPIPDSWLNYPPEPNHEVVRSNSGKRAMYGPRRLDKSRRHDAAEFSA